MVQVRTLCQTWGAWTHGSLLHLLFLMDLIVRSSSIYDNLDPPSFLPSASDITVREGDVAILPCTVKDLGTRQVAWRKIDADDILTIGEMTWIGDDKIAVEHKDKGNNITIWNLIIDKVGSEDAGVYECQVTSKLGYNKMVKLNVVGPPITEPVISIEGKRYVDLGEKIHLICNASGGARIPEDIDWFKEGNMVDSFTYPHVRILKYQSIKDRSFISELVIDRARRSDSGEYTCRSSRQHIVSMKVTILKADSTNKRRGTDLNPDSFKGSTSAQFSVGHILHLQTALLMTYFCLTWTLRS